MSAKSRTPLKVFLAVCFAFALVPALLACSGGGSGSSGGGGGASSGHVGSAMSQDSGGASGTTSGPAYTMPSSSAANTFDSAAAIAQGDAKIDVSSISEGTVGASATNASRLKFQVTSGEMSYNYDLPGDGTPIIVPLNMGNGDYTFRVMQNTSGNNYVEIASVSQPVTLSDEFAPFLVPNMYVDYADGDPVVLKAREIANGSQNEGDVVRAVYSWIVDNVDYDFPKAEKLSNSTGYVPDPASTLQTKSGICFDYASLAAAMLRSLNIPTKVITGYVDPEGVYHAWNMIYIDGTWTSAEISIPSNEWSRVDTTFAATSDAAGNTANKTYTERYTY